MNMIHFIHIILHLKYLSSHSGEHKKADYDKGWAIQVDK